MTEVVTVTVVCDVNLRSERDQGSQVELDICKWQAAVVRSFGEAQGYSVCSLQR